ncbi:DUF167 domain-containing protein [Aurantiacibacter poecillastricola]|uniref:DUF167 domain-containing protein n=1 Tax=Aurantiacibacter poecillastricola TaxID=3064385 RepID=UPI00273DDD51|nr:DUF167 domain-containing protein [Aurantiacibacter sp. 219JJ12-13]MDP5260479.1 DUF167 domain-containing protein [Aurantiacibacter sp. 219JJ12-13]
MARPKIDLPPADAIRALADSEGRLAVRVTPGARSQEVAVSGAQLLVKTRAKPQDGAANEAVRVVLAEALDCAPSQITLLRGATSREKLFRIP